MKSKMILFKNNNETKQKEKSNQTDKDEKKNNDEINQIYIEINEHDERRDNTCTKQY